MFFYFLYCYFFFSARQFYNVPIVIKVFQLLYHHVVGEMDQQWNHPWWLCNCSNCHANQSIMWHARCCNTFHRVDEGDFCEVIQMMQCRLKEKCVFVCVGGWRLLDCGRANAKVHNMEIVNKSGIPIKEYYFQNLWKCSCCNNKVNKQSIITESHAAVMKCSVWNRLELEKFEPALERFL